MKKILFVDDEAKVLSGLSRMLRGLRHEWDMIFVESGSEVLSHLAVTPFDVVVTDMRMPCMDGAQLLSYIAELYPSVVRIVLSGQCERNAVLKCVGPAHQFLTKPCDSEMLKATVARACQLRDHLSDEVMKNAVSRVQSLPSQLSSYLELRSELRSPSLSMKKIGQIIAKDPPMAAKVLQLVSSGFFGSPQRVHDVGHAVQLLGSETIRDLMDHTDSFLPITSLDESPDRKTLWRLYTDHSLRVAVAAREIAQAETNDTTMMGTSYVGGLLHNIAVYVLSDYSTRVHAITTAMAGVAVGGEGENAGEATCSSGVFEEIEENTFRAQRDLAGAYLLGLWGVPDHIVHVVSHYLRPSESADTQFGPLAAVHVANSLLEDAIADTIGVPTPLDREFLERIGCEKRLDAWREICLSIQSEGVLS